MRIIQKTEDKYAVIDTSTGEILSDNVGMWLSKSQVKARENYKSARKRLCNDKRSLFIWFSFCGEDLFGDMSSQNIMRLMCLSTYLPYGEINDTDNEMPINQVRERLSLRYKAVNDFLIDACDAGYINTNKDKAVCLSHLYFFRGKIRDSCSLENARRYIKIKISGMRDLYRTTTPRQHKIIGYIFKLIPYINVRWNVLCHNIYEEDLDSVVPLTPSEICSVLGYSSSNSNHLVSALMNVSFVHDNSEANLLSRVVLKSLGKNKNLYLVNHRVVCAGNAEEDIEKLEMCVSD